MSENTAPSTVLLVDDEPELRALLAEYFGRNGFTVMQAEHAAARGHTASSGVVTANVTSG